MTVERIDSIGERTSFGDFVPFFALGGLIGLCASYYKDKLNNQEKAAELAKKRNMHVIEFCHDIRGPLGGVIHGIKLIPSYGMSLDQEEALRLTKVSASIANDMVQNLLNSQKEGGTPLKKNDFELKELLDGVVFQVIDKAQAKNLKFRVIVGNDVPTVLFADRLNLSRILVNLATNAIKFTEEGTVTIRIQNIQRHSQLSQLEFSVSDTGCGINPKKIPFLFQRGAQADTHQKKNGNGLGLSICNTYLQRLNGETSTDRKIQVRDSFDKGFTYSDLNFIFHLYGISFMNDLLARFKKKSPQIPR